MIIPARTLELVLNPRIRQRTIELPVRYGKFGERRRCQAKAGGVYCLQARAPYERYRSEAEHQATRAKRVLWLLERCEEPQRTATVTVVSVEYSEIRSGQHGECWVVRFVMGERDLEHKPRLLKASYSREHYTSSPSLALSGCAEEIGEAWQGKYSKAADEARRSGASEYRERLLAAVGELRLQAARLNAGSSLSRKRLKTIEHNLRALEHEWRRSA